MILIVELIVELCALLEEREREVVVIGWISQTLVTAVIFLQCFDVVTDCIVGKVMQSVVFIGPFPLFFCNKPTFECDFCMCVANGHSSLGIRSEISAEMCVLHKYVLQCSMNID